MVRRAAVDHAQVNVGAGRLRESLKEILGQFRLKVTDALRADFAGDDAVRASAEIDRRGGQRLVHRHQKISGSEDAALVADGFGDGFAKRDSGIFDGMVLIDVEITFGVDIQIERSVAGDEIEHVIKKSNTGGDFGCAAAIEIQAQLDLGLVGFAIDSGDACARHSCSGLSGISESAL